MTFAPGKTIATILTELVGLQIRLSGEFSCSRRGAKEGAERGQKT